MLIIWVRVFKKSRWGNHILHAFLLDLLHISLVLKHAAQVFDLADVANACLLKFNAFTLHHVFIHFRFGVVWVEFGTRLVFRIIFFYTFNYIKPLLDFLKECFGWVSQTICILIAIVGNVKVFTTSNLVKIVALTWIFIKNLIH